MSKLDALAKDKDEKAGKLSHRSKGYMLYLVVLMGLVGLMDNFLSQIESVAVPYLLADFGITADFFALWQGIYGIITFAVFFIAWISDAFGRKKGILVLVLVMGVPALFIGITAFTFHLFMILYAIIITATLSNMWELPIVEESQPKKRGLYGGITFLIGLIPVFAFVGVPIAEAFGWRWTYGVMFFLMVFVIILWFFMKEPQRWVEAHAERGNEFLKIKAAFKSVKRKDLRYILIASLVYGVWTVSFKIGTTWGGYYYMNVIGLTPGGYRSILTIGGLLTMVGALLAGISMDKLGRNLTLIIGCGGSIIGFVFLGITTLPIFFWMIYLFMPMVLAYIMVYFNEIFPTAIRSTCTGITATAARLSYVLGPLLASTLLLAFPDMGGFWIIAGLLMIIPIFSLFVKPYETKGKTLEEIQEER